MKRKSKKLTRKEEVMRKYIEERKRATAREAAEEHNISYTAAYDLLESLKERGVIGDEWENKGNKKFYYLK